MFRAVLLMLVFVSTQGLAQSSIYRTTDENGDVVFTDAPPAGTQEMERIENPHINSMPPPPSAPAASANNSDRAGDEDENEAADYAITITSPKNETTIPHGPGNFSVSARVSPAIGTGLSLQLFLDGVPWGEPQVSPSWSLTNIIRGEHHLTIGVVNGEGKASAISEPVTVFVFRPIAGR
jgi:hypothetical protein